MERQENSEKIVRNGNTYRLVSYGLVAALLACAALTVAAVINGFNPELQLSYLGALCFIVALDRLYSYRLFRDRSLGRDWLLHFGVQSILLLALTRVMVSLSHGGDAFLAEIPLWQQDFLAHFFTLELIFPLIMVIITWQISGDFADMLEEIRSDQIKSARADLARVDRKKDVFGLSKNVPARGRLVTLFFSMGIILVILTAIGRFEVYSAFYRQNFSALVKAPLPLLAAGGASTLLYFILGLALLSQTEFISLHARWAVEKIPVNGSLAKQWTAYSLLFLGLMVFLVSLLPTNFNIQLAANPAILRPISLARTATPTPTQAMHMPTPSPFIYSSPTRPPVVNSGWLDVVKAFFFWTIFLGLLFFAVRQYLRQEALEWLRKLSGWKFLAQLWGWLQSLWTRAKSRVVSAVVAGRERAFQLTTQPGSRFGFMHPRQLDSRQRIYFFYLALVRRSGEKGLPRSISQTPAEYAAALQAALPTADEDIHALTQAFVDARYGRRPVQPEQAQRVESAWERIRRALRGKLRS